jgi:protease-4
MTDAQPALPPPHPSAPYAPYPPYPPYPPPRRRSLLRTLFVFMFVGFGALMLLMFGFQLGIVSGGAFDVSGLSTGVNKITYQHGQGRQRIAILPIVGVIDSMMPPFVRNAVETILADSSIRAVVLRVESPGGDATASDEIHRHLRRLQSEGELPVVASYGDMAASGGYYVSCAADHILAQPTTITGSIGVIAPFMTVHRLLEKIGVDPQVMTSTAAVDKDMGSPFRPWTDKDRAEVRQLLDAVQEQFVSVVVEGRKAKMTRQQVLAAATGKGLIAAEALDAKLIDAVGYLDDAIAHARKLSGIDAQKPPVIYLAPHHGLWSDLFGVRSPQRAPSATLDPALARRFIHDLAVPRMMYLFQ